MCFFQYFKILIFQVVSGVKEQKMVQNNKKFCLLHFISQELYIIWLSLNDNIFRCVVHFPKILIFWVHRGVKRVKKKKKNQNDKKFCLLRLMSQEPYIIWLSFMVQMCKIIIFQGVFLDWCQRGLIRLVLLVMIGWLVTQFSQKRL